MNKTTLFGFLSLASGLIVSSAIGAMAAPPQVRVVPDNYGIRIDSPPIQVNPVTLTISSSGPDDSILAWAVDANNNIDVTSLISLGDGDSDEITLQPGGFIHVWDPVDYDLDGAVITIQY